ncbi:MAG: hypothetical protein KME52_03445 [Desmonostoc geniculatum HA4340-LM1]|nr:hypothetical protein [Desmonostoc geniculatum HA4340-LM1]
MLASSSSDRTVKLWRLDGTEIATFRGHTAGLWGLAFSPDGSILASTSGDKTVKLWRLHTSPTPKRLGESSLFKTLQGQI